MEKQPTENLAVVPSGRGARFRWKGLLLWLPACLLCAVLVSKAAVVAQSYFAPLIFFPLLVGLVLGAILVGIMLVGQVANRPTVLMGTVLAATVAVVGQHYFCYQASIARTGQQLNEHPEAGLAFADELGDRVPANFGDYLGRQAEAGRALFGKGLTVWFSWGLDAVLLLAAALATVATSMRRPYCDRCGSWYRTTRAGELDLGVAKELAGLVGIRLPRQVRSACFRLQACTGGCGPTIFELSWERTGGGRASGRVRLDVDRRERVSRVLDAQIDARPPAT